MHSTPICGGSEKRSRDFNIDTIRGLSILFVLLHHFLIAYPPANTSQSNAAQWDVLAIFARNGNYGVVAFFVISGYLITNNIYRRWCTLRMVDLKVFYIQRVARLVPCLLILVCVTDVGALAGVRIFENHSYGGKSISLLMVNIASLTLWMNILVINYGWINYPLGVLWSLSVEGVFYILFPILCRLFPRVEFLAVILVLLALLGPIFRWFNQGEAESYLYHYFSCFDSISIGCLAAIVKNKFYRLVDFPLLWRVLIAVIMLVVCLSWPIAQSNVLGVTALGIGTATLIIGTVGKRCDDKSGLYWLLRPVEWCGERSYEIYLFHLIVLGGFVSGVPANQVSDDQKLGLLTVFIFAAAAFGGAMAFWVSEPLNKFIRLRAQADSDD